MSRGERIEGIRLFDIRLHTDESEGRFVEIESIDDWGPDWHRCIVVSPALIAGYNWNEWTSDVSRCPGDFQGPLGQVDIYNEN